jgi:hypothetical protein
VSEYALGGLKLRAYGGMDTAYVRPPVLLVDPTAVALAAVKDDSSKELRCCVVQ